MHINFDKQEDLEMMLAAEFYCDPDIRQIAGGDAYKLVDKLACDLDLDMGILDVDEIN